MSFTKNDQAVVLNRESLQYLANCIRLVHSLPDLLNDVLPSQTTTYSSYKVTELLNTLNTDLQNYVNNALGNLSHLKKEIVSVTPTDDSADEDTIYLVQDVSGGYEQYLKINGVVTSLGSTSVINNVYTKTESDAKFALLSTLNSLITVVGGLNDLTTTDKTSIVNAINELKSDKVNKTDIVDNLTSTDTDKPLSANQGKALKDEVDLKANGDTVIKKSDIKTTLDKNSTNDDVCGGKAIFDAIQANAIGKETALYEGRISATGTYTLADDVNNYDFIIINHRQESGVNCQSTTLSKYEISKCSDYEHKFMCVLGYGSSEDCTSGYFNNDKLILSSYNFQTITSITGYKFGQVTVQNTITNPSLGESYSTDEQLTGGTWIDGKPLYKRTFVTTAPSSVNTITNIVTLDEAIEPVNMYGFLMRDNGSRMMLLMYINDSQTGNISIWHRRNDGNHIGMITGGSANLNKPVYVTVEYTKTTDA